jgi:hypothetical protein
MPKTLMIIITVVVIASANAFAGQNPLAKVAVHVIPHASRSCTKSFPSIATCEDIITTEPSPDVDAFPVFFDLTEYQGLEYGMTWPGMYTAVFTSCSDLTIGGIVATGDGVSHAWTVCQYSGVAIPGWAWIYDYGVICVVPSPENEEGEITIGDCTPEPDVPVCVFCAGIGDSVGDDPCIPISTEPTTWGAIKGMYR